MISKIINQKNIDKIDKMIEKSSKVVIVCHRSPDGDAIGASLGLWHFLMALDTDVIVVVPDALPDNLSFLVGTEEIVVYDQQPEEAAHAIAEADLLFCLDFNTPSRLGNLMPLVVKSTARKVLIDHHPNPDTFCEVIVSHPEISSTSEMIFRLICRLGLFDLISVPCGEAIYTGMMTDTGNFTYNSNKPEIYAIIYQLVKKGIDKDAIYSRVLNTNSADKLRLQGYATSEKMRIYPQHKAALISLTLDELNKHNYKKGDAESLVNIPLSVEGIVFSVFLRQDTKYIKVSLRSKGEFDCNKIATTYFNGGGHVNASGGEFYGTMEEAEAVFENLLPIECNYNN